MVSREKPNARVILLRLAGIYDKMSHWVLGFGRDESANVVFSAENGLRFYPQRNVVKCAQLLNEGGRCDVQRLTSLVWMNVVPNIQDAVGWVKNTSSPNFCVVMRIDSSHFAIQIENSLIYILFIWMSIIFMRVITQFNLIIISTWDCKFYLIF